MCQLHISLTRAAQIYLELHFCVELHTKTRMLCYPKDGRAMRPIYGALKIFMTP